ncbi:MAG: cytochrome b/b6 domain-containing protein [Actinomycetota bacterium]
MGEEATTYHPALKALHWIIFVLFTIMFVLGYSLSASDGYTALGAQWGPVFDWHATLGLFVFILAVVRIVMRRRTPLPSWSPGLTTGERALAHRTEQVLYAVMILKPVSGYIMAGRAGYNIDLFVQWRLGNPFGESFVNNDGGLYTLAIWIHIITGIAFIIAWLVHVTQVVRHTVIKKDRLLQRMLP